MPQPSLDQYPGYFPPAKKPFWTRTKASITTGAVALVVGLLIGASVSGQSAPPRPAAAVADVVPQSAVQQQIDDAVASRTADLRQQNATLRSQRSGLQRRLSDQRTAATNHLADVRANLKEKQRHAVAAARADERAKATQNAPTTSSGTTSDTSDDPGTGSDEDAGSTSTSSGSAGGGTDPRFGTCGDANDAGYGPYVEGQDPEYDWYEDRDGDGIDCEP